MAVEVRAGVAAALGIGAIVAVFVLFSRAGALHTLEPKAGTAAGGDEGRGAYRSLDASARLARSASSFPGSRRRSLDIDGSMAMDCRREYESTWGPARSEGEAWCEAWGVGPVGVPGT